MKAFNTSLKYTAIAGIFLISLVPLIITSSLFFPFITGKNFFFRIVIEIAFAAWAILAIRDRRYAPKKSFLCWSLLIFLAVIALSDMFSPNPEKSFWSNFERMEGLVTHIHLFLYFIVAATILSTEKLWNWFLHTNIAVSLFLTFYSFLQIGGELVINQGGVRVDGTLGNAAYLAVYLLFTIYLLLFLLLSKRESIQEVLLSFIGGSGLFLLYYLYHLSQKGVQIHAAGGWLSLAALVIIGGAVYLLDAGKSGSKWGRTLLYIGLVIPQAIILYFTATRGAILGGVAGIVFISVMFALFERESRLRRNISIALVALIILFGSLFITLKDSQFVKNNPVLSRFSSLISSDFKSFFTTGAGKSRYLNAKSAIAGLKERPILGWGQESFNYVFYKYYQPQMYSEEAWFDRAHDVVFDWLVVGGILGLLGYLSIFFFCFYYLWRKKGKENPLPFSERVALSGLLIAYFLQNLTVFDNITSYIMFFTFLGYLHFAYGPHVLPPKTKVRKADNMVLGQVFSSLIVVMLLISLYFVNLKPILAAGTLSKALFAQKEGLEKNIEYFNKALSYNTFGNSEIREFIGQTAQQISSSNSIDAKTKDEFLALATSQFDLQLKQTPLDVRYYYFAGITLDRFRNYKAGISYLEKAAELSPKKQLTLFELGSAYINTGDFAKAKEVLKRAYEAEPNFDQAKIMYAISAIYANDEALARSLLGEKYADLIVTDPRFINAFSQAGDYKMTAEIYKKWIATDPTNDQYHVSLAATYLKLNERVNAVMELREAIQINPKFKEQGEALILLIQQGKI